MIFSLNKLNILPVNVTVLFVILFILTTLILFIFLSIKFKKKRRKIIGIWGLTWLAAALLLFCTGAFGRFVNINNANSKMYSKKQLTQDLQQLEGYIMKQNPLFFADRNQLNDMFSSGYKNIRENMTELEFYRLVNPIVAAVHCGHTNLSTSEALVKNRKNTARFFPLKVALVGNQLYALEGNGSKGINAGDEILSINGKRSDEIIITLLKNISGDGKNESKPRYIISRHFNSRFFDFIDNSESFKVQLPDKNGSSKTVTLNAKYNEALNTSAWALHSADINHNDLYNSKIYKTYAILNVHFFMPQKDKKFSTFLDDFFLKLKEKNITKLIIDLRGNFGGTPDMSQSLLSHLIKEKINYFDSDLPFLYKVIGMKKYVAPTKNTFDGDAVLLTDGACFSTAGHFCALVKYNRLATLVGSETGGTYACTDSSKDMLLNNTRIRIHYSTLAYKVYVRGFSKDSGIKPDIYVTPKIEDILSKRDVVMERGLKALGL